MSDAELLAALHEVRALLRLSRALLAAVTPDGDPERCAA